MKGYKFRIYPTKEQQNMIWKNIYGAKEAYNWTIARRKEMLETGVRFQKGRSDLRNEFSSHKKTLNSHSNRKTAPAKYAWNHAVDEANATFDKFGKRAKFRTRKNWNHMQYKDYLDKGVFEVGTSGFKLSKVGWVKAKVDVTQFMGKKLQNVRIKYNGLHYTVSFSTGVESQDNVKSNTEAIGIDLGVKTFATCSNGWVEKSPSKDKYNKRMARLQRKADKRYKSMTKGQKKSKRLLKLEKQILKTHKKIANIQDTFIHGFTNKLIQQNPEKIVIEDIKYSEWSKDRHKKQQVSQDKFFEFRRQLEYKCKWYGIELIFANKWFASTQTCSACGNRKRGKNKLQRNERAYTCGCGLVMDRDFNASINLKNYAPLR